MKSILNTKYNPPNRPISLNELNTIRKSFFKNCNLSDVKAHHNCKHFYFVKKNSKKEKEIKEKNTNIGNCSCCWKFNNTPVFLKNKAYNLIEQYHSLFYEEPKKLTYDLLDIETTYYKWLYEDDYSNK